MKNGFAGTGQLFRHLLRVDRIKLALWLLGLSVLIGMTPTSIRTLTENEAEAQGVLPEVILSQQATLLETNGASVALQGPPDSLDTFGGRYAFEIGAFTYSLIALMSVLLIARHTRAEEESGRTELVRSAAVGAWSPAAAVAIAAIMVNALLVVITTAVFLADGQPAGSSVLFACGLGLCGLFFAAAALVWVQVFEHGRSATGASMATLAVAFAIRAVGDVREGWLSLLSPIGWSQRVDPFGDRLLWPLGVSLIATVALVGLAAMLVVRRDVGGGLIAQRPGPDHASDQLPSPLGLAWRLQRQTLVWWCVGLAFLGGIYGSIISSIDDFLDENETMKDILESMGMAGEELRPGFITVVLSMLAIVAAGGITQSVLRPRGEENDGRVELILGASVPRHRWFGAHLLLTFAAAPVFMFVAALGLGLADAAMVGSFTDFGDLIWASLARVPALWAIAGAGVLLYGASKRLGTGVWFVFGASAVIFFFGDLLRLPDMVRNLTPIAHLTHLPGGDQGWMAIVSLMVLTLASTAGGLFLFNHRDIDTA